jgi:hypothetical protein
VYSSWWTKRKRADCVAFGCGEANVGDCTMSEASMRTVLGWWTLRARLRMVCVIRSSFEVGRWQSLGKVKIVYLFVI